MAKSKADTLKFYVATKAAVSKSAKLKKQSESIVQYADNIETYKKMTVTQQKSYQKTNKAVNYKVKKGKN
jgi:hypothetical protein